VMFGLIPVINTDCEEAEDGHCQVKAQLPCGGLMDMLESLDEAFECLDLEEDFEAPSFVYPADYSI
jgi:hypothetical protein